MAEPLSLLERRVLGVLVEKALTAAAPEPLSLNSVVVGSNQKSNRDPVMAIEEPEADTCLEGLQRKGLVFRVTGGRVERWRHNLYDAWKVTKPELAILAELLLRGPQTAAEVRSRASRMEPLDHEQTNELLRTLVERGMVVWLTPEARRGAVLTHGFHPPEELERLRAGSLRALSVEAVAVSAAPPPPDLGARLDRTEAEIGRLSAEVQSLRAAVQRLYEALGMAGPG